MRPLAAAIVSAVGLGSVSTPSTPRRGRSPTVDPRRARDPRRVVRAQFRVAFPSTKRSRRAAGPRQALPANRQVRAGQGTPHHLDNDVPRDGHAVMAGAGRDGDGSVIASSSTSPHHGETGRPSSSRRSARYRPSAGRDYAGRFPEIAEAVRRLPAPTLILDGEVARFDEQLVSRFHLLQRGDRGVRSWSPPSPQCASGSGSPSASCS